MNRLPITETLRVTKISKSVFNIDRDVIYGGRRLKGLFQKKKIVWFKFLLNFRHFKLCTFGVSARFKYTTKDCDKMAERSDCTRKHEKNEILPARQRTTTIYVVCTSIRYLTKKSCRPTIRSRTWRKDEFTRGENEYLIMCIGKTNRRKTQNWARRYGRTLVHTWERKIGRPETGGANYNTESKIVKWRGG